MSRILTAVRSQVKTRRHWCSLYFRLIDHLNCEVDGRLFRLAV
ncbi:MAG: hypothetical protein ACLR8L_16270 [Oscillospiraceae bacterium]